MGKSMLAQDMLIGKGLATPEHVADKPLPEGSGRVLGVVAIHFVLTTHTFLFRIITFVVLFFLADIFLVFKHVRGRASE